MGQRIFRNMKRDSTIDHWRWTKSKGMEVSFTKNASPGKYIKSEYTLKEFLSRDNGESYMEI